MNDDKFYKQNTILKYKKYVEDFRESYIPELYNPIELMDYLFDDELDHYISISNRADGKSFNYIHFLMNLSIDYEIGFTLIARHYTIREAYINLIQKILNTFDTIDGTEVLFLTGHHFDRIAYKGRIIGIITDLNNATQTKYHSAILQDFSVIVYDEFLAIEGDYLPDEWERLKTIYESIDRKPNRKYFSNPKILYLGNAVNFSSPVLANLEIFNILESHKMNTVKKYDNVALEFRRNDKRNEIRNTRAFKSDDDAMVTAQFKINKHNIADENETLQVMKNHDYFVVKLEDRYIKVTYNIDTLDAILTVIPHSQEYFFNMEIVDNIEGSTFLKDNFYTDEHYLKYDIGIYKFENAYSKEFLLGGYGRYRDIDILKLIRYHLSENSEADITEKQYTNTYIEKTKRNLYEKFFR